jgi:hypothetical protein
MVEWQRKCEAGYSGGVGPADATDSRLGHMLSLHPNRPATQPQYKDLDSARGYLNQVAPMCAEAAGSPDSRTIWLALGVLQRAAEDLR